MKFKATLPVLAIFLFLAYGSSAQEVNTLPAGVKQDYVRCIDMNNYEEMLEKQDPTRKVRRQAAIDEMKRYIELHRSHRVDSVAHYTIPVVFHVLWNASTPAEKISLAQIKRQVQVMNKDYNRRNSDTTSTPSAFKPAAASFNITFCLAQTDPNGNATTGVVYKQTTQSGFSYTNNGVKCPSQGGDTIWDPNQYLNIWICNIGGGVLGFSEFPTTPLDNTYGSVIFYQAVGDSGYLPLPKFNLGRTITHETGHLMDLHHTWGDDNGLCPSQPGGADDGAADTPPEGNNKTGDGYGSGWGPTFGCPPFPYMDNCSTTSPGIMFENFMEYTNDSCMNIFTNDQYTIALAALNGPLKYLIKSSTCNPPNSVQQFAFSNSVSIYPNPGNGIFNLQIANSYQLIANGEIDIYNLLGKKVFEHSFSAPRTTLDLSDQPEGLYFVKISDGNYSVVKKVLVSR